MNLKDRILSEIDNAKGQNCTVLDVRGISDVTDFMIIASGTSKRHVSSVASKVEEAMREQGARAIGVEGKKEGDWVLLDFGDVIVHIMLPDIRDFYNLEKLWGELSETGAAKG